MKASTALVPAVAALALALVGASVAAADPGDGTTLTATTPAPVATTAPAAGRGRTGRQRVAKLKRRIVRAARLAIRGNGVLYRFGGPVVSVASNGVTVDVQAGNHAALRRLVGRSAQQTFAVGDSTEFLAWSGGVPSVVDESALKTGDWVAVSLRAPAAASLARIERRPAGIVSDYVNEPAKPDQPLYLFRGKLQSTGDGSLTLNVVGGNDRALRLLVGSSRAQTFAVGDSTIVLDWRGKVPTVISLSDLKPGAPVTVRIRAKAGADLSEVEATAAVRVAEHEPAGAGTSSSAASA